MAFCRILSCVLLFVTANMAYIVDVIRETVSKERNCFRINDIPEGMSFDSIELMEYAESDGFPLRPALRQGWREIAHNLCANFDFQKIRDVMLFLDWRWGSPPVDKTPSISEMEEIVTHLVYNSVLFQEDYSSGGFEVYWHSEGLGLRFCLEEYPA